MDAHRFEQLLDAYGADPRRWPEAEREAARAFAAAPNGARLLGRTRLLDDALDAAPRPYPSAALRDRVIAQAAAMGLTPRRARAVWERLGVWLGAGWAAAACAGVVAGAGLSLHLTSDAQADAVLYQASLSGVDDQEVLG